MGHMAGKIWACEMRVLGYSLGIEGHITNDVREDNSIIEHS